MAKLLFDERGRPRKTSGQVKSQQGNTEREIQGSASRRPDKTAAPRQPPRDSKQAGHKQQGGAGRGHKRKHADGQGEDNDAYKRALRRMEMGPMDDDDSLSDLSDIEEDAPEPSHAAEPHRQSHAHPRAQQQAAQHPLQRKAAAVQLRSGQAHDDSLDSDHGSEQAPSSSLGSDGSDDEGPTEVGRRGGAETRPARGGAAGPSGRQPASARGVGGEDSGSDEKSEGLDEDEEKSEGGLSEMSDESESGSEDPDEIMQQMAELPLEMRVALLQSGEGPSGQAAKELARAAKEQEASFKRLNRHRPQEMSSKRPVSRFRTVVEPSRKVAKDPRFARLEHDKDKEVAAKRYAFLYDDVLVKERAQLKAQIKKERNASAKAALSAQLQRVEQALSKETQRRTRQEVETKFKAEQRKAVESGKTPFFLKDSDKRKLELVAKYQQLQKKGKLDRYMEKRRKRNASKDHRYVPGGRRGEQDGDT